MNFALDKEEEVASHYIFSAHWFDAYAETPIGIVNAELAIPESNT